MIAAVSIRRMAVAGAALTALAVAPDAYAQEQTDYLSITARGGVVNWEAAASMVAMPFVGLDGQYAIGKYLGIGSSVMVGRSNTQKEDFLTTLTFGDRLAGDTTSYYQTGQPVSFVDIGAYAMLRLPTGEKFKPYAIAGGGVYSMFFDPQINRGERRMVNPSINLGAGFWYALSDRAGLQFDVRALTLTDYDWRNLDPTRGQNQNVTFLEDFPTPPERKNTVTNLTYSIGFRYIPGFFGGDN